jgi:hypothetical protein
VDLGVGWPFLLTGFLATWRRPANRPGWLLTATGLSWFAGNLRFIGHPVAFALGSWLAESPTAVLGHLVFAFPTGRVESRAQRLFVASNYGAIIGLSGLRTLALRPVFQAGCHGGAGQTLRRCTTNAALILRSPSAYPILRGLHDVVLTGITLVALGLLVHRWLRATPPARRTLAPVLMVGAVLGCLFIAVDFASVAEASRPGVGTRGADRAALDRAAQAAGSGPGHPSRRPDRWWPGTGPALPCGAVTRSRPRHPGSERAPLPSGRSHGVFRRLRSAR